MSANAKHNRRQKQVSALIPPRIRALRAEKRHQANLDPTLFVQGVPTRRLQLFWSFRIFSPP